MSFSLRRERFSKCSCQRRTLCPSPVIRTALKIASHRLSMACSSLRSGNTRFAQEGMGMEAIHQGKPLLICRR